jgi:hypothetical protein
MTFESQRLEDETAVLVDVAVAARLSLAKGQLRAITDTLQCRLTDFPHSSIASTGRWRSQEAERTDVNPPAVGALLGLRQV